MVPKIIVKKILSDQESNNLIGKKLPSGYFKKVIKKDCDVFTEDGKCLLRFRKNVLPKQNIEEAYNAMIDTARKYTTTRGIAGGDNGTIKLVSTNEKIQSNIIGYFDTFSIRQKYLFREAGMKVPPCRQTAFTGKLPNQWKKVIPLIKDINAQYRTLFPKEYKKQYREAHKTKYVIPATAFSTITTNLNLQTAVHTDKGDYKEGFGNLVVIEKGKYKGGYTGFPQYGVAVDVRSGDFLGMDVHQVHGNEPIIPVDKNSFERLSLVSYLRQGIVDNCKGIPILPQSVIDKASARFQINKEKNEKKGKQGK